MNVLRFHLAHHLIGSGAHGDLFLDTDEQSLPTYEISEQDLKALQAKVSGLESFRFELSADVKARALGWPVYRKADHRRKYLEYEGPISGDRGYLKSVFKGNANFSFPLEPLPEKLWFEVHTDAVLD